MRFWPKQAIYLGGAAVGLFLYPLSPYWYVKYGGLMYGTGLVLLSAWEISARLLSAYRRRSGGAV